MYDAELKVTNPQLFSAYADTLQQAPELTRQVIDREVNSVGDDLLVRLRTEPGPVVYAGTGVHGQPVLRWKSAKQRQAFFASNGFGGGIPSSRKHILVQSWKIRVVYGSDEITSIAIENDAPEREFVTGQYQQPYHFDTGWPDETVLLADAGRELADRVETGLLKVMYAIDALAETRMGR